MAFRCDYLTPHGQLLDLSDVDVNASYFEFAQIYLLRSERHGPMYFGSPLFRANSPTGFRSEVVNPFLPQQYRASDHLAAKSRAVLMVQLQERIHFGFGVANAGLEETGEPLQYYYSLLVANGDLEQPIAVEKVVEHFPFGVARLGGRGEPGEIAAAENRTADFSQHCFV